VRFPMIPFEVRSVLNYTVRAHRSDKASVEITSPFSGTVTSLAGKAGDMLKVGSTLCSIEVDGGEAEDTQEDLAAAVDLSGSSSSSSKTAARETQTDTSTSSPMDASPLEPPLERHVPASSSSSSSTPAREILATPGTRRFAMEKGVDLATVTGTGRHGRIMKEDILAAASGKDGATSTPVSSGAPSTSSSSPSSTAAASPPTTTTSVPLSPIRRAMFRAMSASLQIPHFAYSDTIDVTALERMRLSLTSNIPVRYRKTLKPADEATLTRLGAWQESSQVESSKRFDRLTMLPFLLKGLSVAMQEHPLFTCSLSPAPSASSSSSSEEPSLVRRSTHDISVALSNPSAAGGLFTPVLRSVDSSSIFDLASRLAHLQSFLDPNASSPPKFPAEYSGAGTLTLSNIGVVGGKSTHPVVPPTGQLAIGAMGRMRVEPRFVDEAGAKKLAQGVSASEEVSLDALRVEPRLVMVSLARALFSLFAYSVPPSVKSWAPAER
jgi:2-oxoisovalerate dehydrogenase E2 component (dihydrolipoyl transacylase)